jgi:hypothetical protein
LNPIHRAPLRDRACRVSPARRPIRPAEVAEVYEEYGLPVQQRHLGKLIGFFVSEIGPLNQVVHLWQYEDLADRQRRRAAMAEDPAWQEFMRRNEELGALQHLENKILLPAAFSPIR